MPLPFWNYTIYLLSTLGNKDRWPIIHGQRSLLFQHVNILVIEQLIGFENGHIMPDGV